MEVITRARWGGAMLLLAAAALYAAPASADVVPGEVEEVPMEVLQRWLCEKKSAGDSCGESDDRYANLCVDARCVLGDDFQATGSLAPCLLCVPQTHDSGEPKGPAGPRVVRFPERDPPQLDDDPSVRRGRAASVGGLALLLLGVGAAFARKGGPPRRGGLALAAAGALVAGAGLAGQEVAAQRFAEARKQAAAEGEVLVLPVQAQVPSKEERYRYNEKVFRLRALLDRQQPGWRKRIPPAYRMESNP